MNRVSQQLARKPALIIFVITYIMIFFFLSQPVFAADLSKEEVKATLNATMTALLSGQIISPDLQQKIGALKSMTASGALSKQDIRQTLVTELPDILNKVPTDFYILDELPGKVDDLLSFCMKWEEMREVIWEAARSSVKGKGSATISIASLGPEGTPHIDIPKKKLIPEIQRLTDGAIKIVMYNGGTMGEDTDILRKMDIGQLDGCGCTAIGILKASPEASILFLPRLFRNYGEVDYILTKFRKQIDEAFRKRGYILAGVIDTGFFYMFSKNKIESIEDLRHQKMSSWFGEVETTFYKELGISATPVAVPELIASLSSNMVDTNLAPAMWLLGQQAYQYVHYYIEPSFAYSPVAIIVSENTRLRLQKQFNVSDTFANNLKEMILYEIKRLEPYWKEQCRIYEQKSLEAFQKKCGMKVATLSPQDVKALDEAAVKVRQELAGKLYPESLLNDVLAALKEYRQAHP